MQTDPVCGANVEEKNPKFQAHFAGKNFVFCSEECKKKFEEKPEEYAVRVA